MSNQRFASGWDAIEDTPQEAENMKLRSALMTALKSHLAQTKMSQAQAAQLLGVILPRISDFDARQDQSVRPRRFGEHG